MLNPNSTKKLCRHAWIACRYGHRWGCYTEKHLLLTGRSPKAVSGTVPQSLCQQNTMCNVKGPACLHVEVCCLHPLAGSSPAWARSAPFCECWGPCSSAEQSPPLLLEMRQVGSRESIAVQLQSA